jgi:hypothetical protein
LVFCMRKTVFLLCCLSPVQALSGLPMGLSGHFRLQ